MLIIYCIKIRKKIYLNLHLVFSQSSPWMSWGLGVLPLGQKPRGRETSTWFWTVQNQFCTSRSKVWTGRICPPCQQAVDWFSSNKTLNIPPTIRCDTEFTINGGKKMIVFHFLRSLVKINLSYNHISDISGFKSLHGSEYKLSHVELHGNQLSSPQHVIKALIGCSNLRQLTLCLDGSSNPLCSDLGQSSVCFVNHL